MPLSHFRDSPANQIAVQSQRSLSAASAQSQCRLRSVSIESLWSLQPQRIRNALRPYGDSMENALRIICNRVAVNVAKV